MNKSASLSVERCAVKKICCIGAGYVGGPTAAVIALKCPEVRVTVVDCDAQRIAAWETDKLPLCEPGLLDVVKRCRGKNLHFSTDVECHANDADIIFICVNTPTKRYGIGKGRAADLTTLEVVARQLSLCCKESKVIVEKSTVPVRSAQCVSELLNYSNGHSATDKIKHAVISNPEFLAEGTAVENLLSPDRVLIGGDEACELSRRGLGMLFWIYEHWIPSERLLITSVWSSELSKLVANAFLAQRISSINSVSALCEASGADIREVSRAIGLDSRIGRHFLQPSLGFGGSCFKKDILNLCYICETLKLPEVADYWSSVLEINDYQTTRFGQCVLDTMYNNLRNKQIAIFGFAFKKDTGDTRESPAIAMCSVLLAEYAKLTIYDPMVSKDQIIMDLNEVCDPDLVSTNVIVSQSALDAVIGAHAIVVCTEWNCFKEVNFEKCYDVMEKPAFVFDGRLILDHNLLSHIGFRVKAIGVTLPDEHT